MDQGSLYLYHVDKRYVLLSVKTIFEVLFNTKR